jgi:hypothetical protein
VDNSTNAPSLASDDFPAFDEAAVRAELASHTLHDLPPACVWPVTGTEHTRWTPAATMLPPDEAAAVRQRVAHIDDPAKRKAAEAELVLEAIRPRALGARIAMGAPRGNLVQRALASNQAEIWRLEADEQRITEALAEVRGFRTVVDPNTGEAVPEEVPVVTGTQRAAYEIELSQIRARKAAVGGVTGQKRVAEAKELEVAARRRAHEERAFLHEVARRTAEREREERIERAVADRAKMRGASVL